MDVILVAYRRARMDFFDRYGYQWPATLDDAFDILEVYPLPRAEVNAVRNAAAGLAEIYAKTANLLASASDDVLAGLGVPSHLRRLSKSCFRDAPGSVLGRLDLARTEEGYKLLEFNADSPGLVVEAFSVNRAVCRAADRPDPNEGCEQALAVTLRGAVQSAVARLERADRTKANVVVSASSYSPRDQAIASYLRDLLQPLSATSLPAEQIAIGGSGLYTPAGEVIDVLVRVFPLQCIGNRLFQQRSSVENSDMASLFSHLVESRRVALINPPAAFLFASKALQAAVWAFFEAGEYFQEPEHILIEKYMLPAYLDLPEDNRAYAVKPIYASEGDSVVLLNSDRKVISASLDNTYLDRPAVYQRFVDLPHEELMTEYGPRKLHLVTSCFVAGGVPSAICIRAGELVTNELAWVLPVCIGD